MWMRCARFFSEQAIGVGRIILLFVINFLAILDLNWKLALVSIVVIPIILVVSLWFFKKVTKAYEDYQEQEAILSTTLQENLTGVRVVKAFARQDYEKDKFEKDNWEKFLRGKILLFMHSLFWPLSDIVLRLPDAVRICLSPRILAISGEISVGTYLAYVGLVVWLIWPIRNLGRIIVQTSTGMVSYDRLMEIVKQEREPLIDGKVPARTVRHAAISSSRMSRSCIPTANTDVLKNVSFHCQARTGYRPARVNRFGQDIAGESAAALPRIHGRTHPARRRGVEGLLARVPAAADRHRGAGTVPVQPLDPREYHLRRWARRSAGRSRERPRKPPPSMM